VECALLSVHSYADHTSLRWRVLSHRGLPPLSSATLPTRLPTQACRHKRGPGSSILLSTSAFRVPGLPPCLVCFFVSCEKVAVGTKTPIFAMVASALALTRLIRKHEYWP